MARKLRAVFYARVSTEEEQQLNALELQIQENRQVIEEKGWELAGAYIDEGRTATTTRRRNAYNQLLSDMEQNRFDIIVVKDQDRLQRNTKDWYLFVDRLVSNDLDLYIYLDNKFFKPEDDALLTGIKAILAEEYSRNLSKKINNYMTRRKEKAKAGQEVSAIGNGTSLGYRIVDGKWVQVPEEIEICKLIWDLYEKHNSLRKARDELNSMGYTNTKGQPFAPESLSRVLKNEKAKGVMVVGKYQFDFNTKAEILLPEEEWIRVPAPELAYVSEERWNRVVNRLKANTLNNRGVPRNRFPLSGKVICGKCGSVCWRQTSGSYSYWMCSKNTSTGDIGCTGTSAPQKKIDKIYAQIAGEVVVNRAEVKKSLQKWLESLRASLSIEVDTKAVEREIKRLESRKSNLTEGYLDGIIPKDEYAVKRAEIDAEIDKAKSQLQPVEENEDVKEIENVLKNLDKEIDNYITTDDFERNKVEWLIEHTERITANGKHYIIELDLLAGAIIAGKDFFLFVHDKVPYIVQTKNDYTAEIRIVA